jgi:hypothetical protein
VSKKLVMNSKRLDDVFKTLVLHENNIDAANSRALDQMNTVNNRIDYFIA